MTTTELSEVLADMRRRDIDVDLPALWAKQSDWASQIESALASAEPVACIDERHLHLLRQNWSQGNTLKHPKDAGEGDVLLYTHAQPAAKVEAPDLVLQLLVAGGPVDPGKVEQAREIIAGCAPTPASVPGGWVPLGLGPHPVRNSCVVYWHESAHGGFPATADEWRDEHHLPFATHWHPGASTNPNPSEPTP